MKSDSCNQSILHPEITMGWGGIILYNELSHHTLKQRFSGLRSGECLTATIPNEDALDQSTIEKICNPANAKIAKDDDSTPK